MREPGTGAVFEPLTTYREYTPAEMEERSREFAADLARRRTVRHPRENRLGAGGVRR